MTEQEFERRMDNYDLDVEYSEYIASQTTIGNGTMLINAMESGDYYEGFKDHMTEATNE